MNPNTQGEIIGGARNDFPRFALRFWHGMCSGPLLAMFREHGWRIKHWPMASSAAALSLLNSANAGMQRVLFSASIARQAIVRPIFVLGHWRSGTTLLHEYLNLNSQFRAPSTLECCCPDHFLLTEWFTRRYLQCPAKRPMDEMAAGWEKPQEDEFALMAMGQPSMYGHIGFPQDAPHCMNSLNFEDYAPAEIQQWGRELKRFFQTLLLHRRGQLLLKSPTHTGRLKHLVELFPDAKFIHISRNPEKFIPSTLHLWRRLSENVALQEQRPRDLRFVMDCFERMYRGYFSGVEHVAPENLIEIRYEDLASEPISTLSRVYDHLALPGFDETLPALRAEAVRRATYSRNQLPLSAQMQEACNQYCGGYKTCFGY